jgi:hypothetical protein
MFTGPVINMKSLRIRESHYIFLIGLQNTDGGASVRTAAKM